MEAEGGGKQPAWVSRRVLAALLLPSRSSVPVQPLGDTGTPPGDFSADYAELGADGTLQGDKAPLVRLTPSPLPTGPVKAAASSHKPHLTPAPI